MKKHDENYANGEVEQQWKEVIDQRTREMAEGMIDPRSVEEMLEDIRAKLKARRAASGSPPKN